MLSLIMITLMLNLFIYFYVFIISMNDINIKKLINNNKWDKIYKLLDKIDIYQNISNGNNIAHLAAINNNDKIINYLLEKDKNILQKSNDDGNTPIHLLAMYGYIDL